MAGVEKVSEQEIIDVAETMLTEVGGDLRSVSARQVRERSGGSNKRVNEIVAAWKERTKGQAARPALIDAPEPAVPDLVAQSLREACDKIRDLGPLVAGLIEAATRAERLRFNREIAAEQQRTTALIEEVRKDAEAAREESHGYSEDLDRLEEEKSALRERLDAVEKDLATTREKTASLSVDTERLQKGIARVGVRAEQATAEGARQKELRELSDRALSRLEAQLAASSDAHRQEMSDAREARRQEMQAFRADYKDAEERARRAAAALSEANATIRRLEEPQSGGTKDGLRAGNMAPG